MKAVLLRDTGKPDRLEYVDVPTPEPADGQKRIRVRAAGINYLDVLMRQGRYPQAPSLPVTPGIEVAGEVDGRRVVGLLSGLAGAYAELACVDEGWLFPLPEGASFEEGASFLMAYLTAYLPLTRLISAVRGSTLLVHAAAGGVGSAAVQLGRRLGARVIATASSEEKRDLALKLGADEAYGYDDFVEAVRADVVLDPVGGRILAESLRVLNPLGAVVAIGYAGGAWQDVSPALLVGRNITLHGFYLGRLMRHRPDVVRAAAEELLELWGQDAIRPLVGSRYPLADAAEAHRLIEQRRHVGKVVLVP